MKQSAIDCRTERLPADRHRFETTYDPRKMSTWSVVGELNYGKRVGERRWLCAFAGETERREPATKPTTSFTETVVMVNSLSFGLASMWCFGWEIATFSPRFP